VDARDASGRADAEAPGEAGGGGRPVVTQPGHEPKAGVVAAESDSARQTRVRGARSRMRFSMRGAARALARTRHRLRRAAVDYFLVFGGAPALTGFFRLGCPFQSFGFFMQTPSSMHELTR